MSFMSVKEAADRWGISVRRVQLLCHDARIEGVHKVGNSYIIPQNAEKPEDMRTKENEHQRYAK